VADSLAEELQAREARSAGNWEVASQPSGGAVSGHLSGAMGGFMGGGHAGAAGLPGWRRSNGRGGGGAGGGGHAAAADGDQHVA